MTQSEKSGGGVKALILYWSGTGNTRKVAETIRQALECQNVTVTMSNVEEAYGLDVLGYDLVILGSPSYTWRPPKPVLDFLDEKRKYHSERSDIKLCAPKVPGRRAVVFCSYSGPHTGINEAIPVCKYMGQFFEHLGFEVLDEWYVVGEFHGREDHSTQGRLGDIRGRPNQQDLAEISDKVSRLVASLKKT